MLVVTDLIQTTEARFGAEGLKSQQEARFSNKRALLERKHGRR